MIGTTTSLKLPLGEHLAARRRRQVVAWLWLGAALTFAMLVVGGVTRLTQSGLSMVEWEPLVGVVPPLNEAQWDEAFAQYQRYPEYQKLRPDMTLAEYKTIFYWEYAHRLLARTIGLVFLVPFVLFWALGYLKGPLTRRLLLLFGLGALQGLMGWLMVASGLVDRPSVAHERLAAHLLLAFSIFAVCLWTAADLIPKGRDRTHALPRQALPRDPVPTAGVATRRLHGWLIVFGVVLVLQVTYGAFVAGLDAGLAFNTYPLMAGGWWPPAAWHLEPPLRNLLDNIATVQWIHRTLPLLLLLMAAGLVVAMWQRRQEPGGRLDDSTVFESVALLLFGTWLLWLHRVTRLALGARVPLQGPVPVVVAPSYASANAEAQPQAKRTL